jgi:hypothetical protein
MRTTNDDLAAKITTQFIEENPVDLVMVRRTKEATGAGGFRWTNPTPQAVQTMRVVLPNRSATNEGGQRTDSSGKVVVPSYLIVAQLDANVERFDLVDIDGLQHEIVWVTSRPLFGRVVCEAVRHAGT